MVCCVLLAATLAGIWASARRLLGGRGIPVRDGVAWRPAPLEGPCLASDLKGTAPLPKRRGWLRQRARSFGFAFEGFGFVVRTQVHMRIHLVAAVLAIALGAILPLSPAEWLWVIAAIVAVVAAECLNSSIEHLCDVVCPHTNTAVKRAKDTAASMVLISAIGAAAVGSVIFLPKLEAAIHGEASTVFPMICESAS